MKSKEIKEARKCVICRSNPTFHFLASVCEVCLAKRFIEKDRNKESQNRLTKK